MIKVLVILIVLILSGIFAYLALSKKKGDSATTLVPGPSSKSEKGKEEPEPEPAPTKEDLGTCELSGNWAMSDECNADGTAIFTQAYKESKPGACPEDQKADIRPCCYQKGDWKDTTPCDEGGRKTQEQTTINCASDLKTRRVECEYVGPWVKTGGCTPDGIQYYNRLTINSAAEPNKSEKCCYTSNWSNWSGWGGCNGSKRYKTRTRKVVNCPSGTPDKETSSQNCGHCAGYWKKNIKCWKTGNVVWGIQQYSKHTYDKYVRTKNASNGGDNSCPSNGTRANWRTVTGGGKHGHQC